MLNKGGKDTLHSVKIDKGDFEINAIQTILEQRSERGEEKGYNGKPVKVREIIRDGSDLKVEILFMNDMSSTIIDAIEFFLSVKNEGKPRIVEFWEE